MRLPLAITLSLPALAAASNYSLAAQGESCLAHCVGTLKRQCIDEIATKNSSDLFKAVGADCAPDPRPWWAADQPSWSVDPKDVNYGKCLGYIGVPQHVPCTGAHPAVRRICHCGDAVPPPTPAEPSSQPLFGTVLSQATITTVESELFKWTVDQGHFGVMTHFWMTAQSPVPDGTLVRYYIDGEVEARIQFTPPMACGTAANASSDDSAPWGTKWFGKGAKDGAWFHNFRVPFQSIRITIQHLSGTHGGMYFIVRGARDLPINIGGVEVPVASKQARLELQVVERSLQPLDFVNVADVPANKSGLMFMSTLAVKSGNLNFLEGCFHAYTPRSQAFPGTIMSSGTEDYYDSAWYFNAGEFNLPVSGFTHKETTDGLISWSAYRFHEMDPMPFSDGLRFVWRNGDATDPATGLKCTIVDGGTTVGKPTVSALTSYAWVYTWASDSTESVV